MRRSAILPLASLTLCCSLQAQISDWSRVERLPVGTRILITTTQRRFPCTIDSVAAAGIGCVLPYAIRWVDRASIESVSVRKASRQATLIGTITGAAAAGTTDATTVGRPATPASRVIGVTLATAIGGGLGYLIGHVVDASREDLIYRRP